MQCRLAILATGLDICLGIQQKLEVFKIATPRRFRGWVMAPQVRPVLHKQIQHRHSEIFRHCMQQRRSIVFAPRIHVGLGIKQRLHNLFRRRTPLDQMQRRISQYRIPRVHVRAMLKQKLHRGATPFLDRPRQQRQAVEADRDHRFHIRAEFHQHFRALLRPKRHFKTSLQHQPGRGSAGAQQELQHHWVRQGHFERRATHTALIDVRICSE